MATTINSITLSPDLNTLFLIDNGRAISFNLKNKNGILVGMLDGQLSVVTAPPVVITPIEDTPDDEPDEPGGGIDDPIKRLAERPKKLKLPAKKAHWNMLFIHKKGVVSIIGALDIDISIIGALDIDISLRGLDTATAAASRDAPTEEAHKCRIYSFDISKIPITIRRVGGDLVITY